MTTADATATRTGRGPVPHRGRRLLLGVALPLLVTAAAWIYIAAVASDLPSQVAVHWGTDGPDRWSSRTELLLVPAILCAVSLAITCPLAALTGRQSMTRRMTVGLSAGLATMFAGIAVATVQVNLTDPPGEPLAGILMASVAGLVVGIAAAAGAGDDPVVRATEPVPADAERADLGPTQRAVWAQGTGVSTGVLVTLVLVMAAIGVLMGVLGSWLWGAVFAIALIALELAFLRFHVRVDADGLVARSMLGMTVLRARADEVVRSDVVQVEPFAEFGGWGLRTDAHGRVGLVTRRGEAIRVERSGGRIQLVTIDDAGRGAALLNTMAERARPVSRLEDTELGDAAPRPQARDAIEPHGPAAGGRKAAADGGSDAGVVGD
ncbi:DUF1648 domain-containing protein [Georgenia sp. Z1344]|uniref:DUF1648 domain-containing protein n=1 Tax=Georgenia sp. Z1344 TaxID=3416706 RepID=UPI003CF2EC05